MNHIEWTELDEQLEQEEVRRQEAEYKRLLGLSHTERQYLVEEWNVYFKRMNEESLYKKAFMHMKEAVLKGNPIVLQEAKETFAELKKTVPFMQKPSAYDPIWLMMKFKKAKTEILSRDDRKKGFIKEVKEALY
jgi:hypothetical protein